MLLNNKLLLLIQMPNLLNSVLSFKMLVTLFKLLTIKIMRFTTVLNPVMVMGNVNKPRKVSLITLS